MSDYDLLVIGGGSGGVRVALGGACVNRGRVPKKLTSLRGLAAVPHE